MMTPESDKQARALASLKRDVERAIKRSEQNYAPAVLKDFTEQYGDCEDICAKVRCCNKWLNIYRVLSVS